MKGVDSIGVKIIFNGVGYNDKYQVKVKIYDKDKIIYDGYSYNGVVNVFLKRNKGYRLYASFLDYRIWTSIYTNSNEYIFSLNNRRTITLFLKDYYYNLPIERGVIVLWQR